MQHYDDILKYHLGEFGAFQKRAFLLLSLTIIPIGMRVASFVFILAETDHWCRIPEYDDLIEQCEYINATTDCDLFVKTITIPKEPVSDVCDTTWRLSSCLRYDINTSDVIDLIDTYDNQTLETRTCDSGMEFDTTQYSSTVIQEFGFVCDWHYLGPLSTSLFLLGPFLGNLIIGHMADRIGRLLTFIINIAIFVVFGLLQAVVRNAVMFMICNFMIGIPYFGIYNQALVLLAEIVGPSKRGTVTMACVLFYAFGYSVLPAIAYYVRDWSVLVLIINLHPIIFFSYWWILAESPRWLLSVGKVKKAKEVMQRMAKVNKVLLPDYIFESEMFETLNSKDSDLKMPIPENGTTDTFITIFRYSNTRKKTLIIYYCSASITLLYYGLTFNVGNLGGNDYTNALIAGAVEILAYSSSMYFVETQLGRKITISVLTVIAIIATISSAFIPQCGDTLWVMVAVYMIGKYATSAAYGVTQLYTGEIFPTTLRAIGVMSAVSLSILASALAPYLLTLRKIWNPLPQLVFGGLSIISACLVLILPETRGRRLPANIQEAEIFGKKQQEPGYEIINVQDKNCVELSEV